MKRIIQTIFYFFTVCFSFLLFSRVYFVILANSIQKEHLVIPCIGMLTMAYFLLTKAKNTVPVFHCCFCCMIVIQIFLGYFLMVEYSTWDVYAVVKNAQALVKGTYYNAGYFARYPNNIGIMLLFAGVFSVTEALWSSTSVYFLVVLNIIAIDTAVILMIRIVRLLYSDKLAYRVGICLTLFAPLYLYVPICYTDTFVMPFLTGAVFLIVKVVQSHEKNRFAKNSAIALLLGCVLTLGMKIKASLIIVIIAAVIYWAYTLKTKAMLHTLAFVITGMLAVSLLWSNLIEPISRVSEELRDQYQFPVYHWIMMGLEGSGNFNSALTRYTASFPTYAEKVTANLSAISEQISELGLLGVLKQLYSKAIKEPLINHR